MEVVLARIATDDRLCREQHRGKRSPFNLVGSVLHSLFGILDESYANKIQGLRGDITEVLHLQRIQAIVVSGIISQVANI